MTTSNSSRIKYQCLLWSLGLGLSACGSNDLLPPPDAALSSNLPGDTVDAGAALDGDSTSITGGALDGGASPVRGIVVVHSDYQSSSVSLLDRDGNLVKDGCMTSGTGNPGLSMTLSEDLALPSQMPPGSPVVIVDRGNATLTWLDPATCAPLGQLAVGTGFTANPHDYVMLSASKAYVPRYKPNTAATPAPGDFDDGNDLLIVDPDPAQAKLLGRIDLLPFAPAGVLPRADRALLIDGTVYVSLNATDAKFSSYATGRIVMVDPSTDQVSGTIDLPGLKDCGTMAQVPGEKKLLVSCTGDYNDQAQVNSSGVAVLDLSVSPPAVAARLVAASTGTMPFSTVAALDDNTIFAVTMGDYSNLPPDMLWVLAQNGAAPLRLYASTESYALGAVLVDAERGRVFLTDGTQSTPASIRVFQRSGAGLAETGQIKSNPTQKLPPRGLAWF